MIKLCIKLHARQDRVQHKDSDYQRLSEAKGVLIPKLGLKQIYM